ncbi:hypothetical protein ASPCAL06629 [Aspergillus calidoustus]|uniref:Carboxylic ester hydrolase n=1 Tax=Aspergillus calidoustus TaxID=454130 RepID=A0A0U5G2U7_ASPCI|nr:hypothetical protein ASPCAL06629 [Aspergillus calidoustus]
MIILLILVLIQGLALARNCANFTLPVVPGAAVLSLHSSLAYNVSFPAQLTGIPGDIPGLNFCNVSLALTHSGANDTVFVNVWLPPADRWNGRYAATGGGGLAAGYDFNMVLPAHSGFATSFTDGGLTLGRRIDPQTGYWGHRPDGTLNTDLLTNLAHRAVHTMSVVSKDVIGQFYGVDSFRSYYTGCSQGGRMGYHSAARYPSDFDGILAVAPALSPELLGPGDFWPFIVMAQEKQLVPTCVFETFQREIIRYCDPLDGLVDGLISHYDLLASCPFDPSSVVGKAAQCGKDTSILVTETHARIVQKIMDGVKDDDDNLLWYGLSTGATFSGIANTTLRNNSLVPAPFPPAAGWLRGMILRNVTANIFNLTTEEYFAAFNESMRIGAKIMGTSGLDLTGFYSAGGKMLTWVGLSDEYINPSNLFRFRDSVAASLPRDTSIDAFYRVFTAPGVGHCRGGAGPLPLDAMGALINWVENGIPPETLSARSRLPNGRVASRNLCKYPAKPFYIGGDIYDSHSFTCRDDGHLAGGADHVIG